MSFVDRYAAVDSTQQAFCYVAGAGLLGTGLAFASAPGHPITIGLFTAGLLIVLLGFVGGPPWLNVGPVAMRRIGLVMVALQLGLLVAIQPQFFIPATPEFNGTPYIVGAVISALLGTGVVALRPARPMLWLGGLTLVHLAVGTWLILSTVTPLSDVWVFQQIGSEELLKGNNPYEITTYPDLYGPGSPFYAPGLVKDGFLTFGFSYPPLSLLMALPGYALFGDHRFAQLVAMSAATWLIATARPGRLAIVPALLFLFTARTFLVLQQGWTDPFVVLLIAATVWLAVRGRASSIVALGLTAAVKQHLLIALPLGALLLRRPLHRSWWTIAWQASTVAAVITVPFILWDVGAFTRSALLLHIQQPFRADSLSYVAWLGTGGQPGLPVWLGFALLIPAMALAFVRAPRTPAGFAAALGVVLLIFFLFSKQSFVHYHYLVIGCLCVAAAAVRPQTDIEQPHA